VRSFRVLMRTTTTLLAGVVVVSLAAYAALLVAGYKPAAVYSGSMVPTLGVGSLAVDRSVRASTVHVGDVVTFQDPFVKGRFVTHRIVRVIHTDHGLAYWTRGDANASRDPWTIQLPDRVGRVWFSVPDAGYVLWYAHTREVRTALIMLASLIVLIALLQRIWRDEETATAAA